MKKDKKDFVPGRNVSTYAAPKERRGVVRFAIEFPLAEFAQVEAASDARGLSVSEYVRELLRERLCQ